MFRTPMKEKNRITKSVLFFCLISTFIVAVYLDTEGYFCNTNLEAVKIGKLLREEVNEFYFYNHPFFDPKISQITSFDNYLSYNMKQGTNFILEAHKTKEIISSFNTNISFQSEILNSSFKIISNTGNNSNEWEKGLGDINITEIISEEGNFSQFDLNSHNEQSSYAINTKFNDLTTPDVINHSTNISFDFRVLEFNQSLFKSITTLGLEFRFNIASIRFILLSYGVNVSTRQYDSLYILCNETPPFNWKQISYNITQLISTYFSQEYYKFSSLEALELYMDTNSTEINITLDIRNLEYSTDLFKNIPITYTLGETILASETGTITFDSTLGNFTLFANDTSPWSTNSQTFLKINITRDLDLLAACLVENWNDSFVTIRSSLYFPQVIENASSSVIHMILPSDWTNIHYVNESTEFIFQNQSQWLNDYVLGFLYQNNVLGMNCAILESLAPNYMTNISIPMDISRNDVIEIRGDLRYPILEYVNVYLHNNSFLFHRMTLPMVNSTFVFFNIEIGEQFPIGMMYLTLNWTNAYEFGKYEKLVYIHEETSDLAIIQVHSSRNFSLYRFDHFFLNLSLYLGNNPYWTNTTFVFLIKGTDCLYLSQLSQNRFYLNISITLWDPGEYLLQIIASDNGKFFATETISVIVKPASIFWNFENLQNELLAGDNISFRLYCFIKPQEGDYYKALSRLQIKIWINETIITSYESNSEGITDINFEYSHLDVGNWLYVVVGGTVEEKIVKLQSLAFYISNTTGIPDSKRAYIYEITKSPIKTNSTFFIYYRIEYSSNDTSWYIPIDFYESSIVSAHILRGSYVIGTHIENQVLHWILYANSTIIDTLVLELTSPIAYIRIKSISKKFCIEIETFSEITINNYTIEIDLFFLGFPFSNLSLFDSIYREISNDYLFIRFGSGVQISNFNIIGGLTIVYYLEGDLQNIILNVNQAFQKNYAYNETITGSWTINTPIEFIYSVHYNLLGLNPITCYNTSVKELPNSSSVITAFLPNQQWNRTVSVYIKVVFFSNLVLVSPIQTFSIIDPFSPILDYSVEVKTDCVLIHAFVHEPEDASGIKDVFLRIEEENYTFNSISTNHFIINFPEKQNKIKLARIVTIDWAGNIKSSAFLETEELPTYSQSVFDVFDPQLFFPISFSLITLGGIGISRMIRKRKTSLF
ncbi:MAG: hypothetical protein ACFFAU_17270 [Candidatus Hodarchaeota archaeon]